MATPESSYRWTLSTAEEEVGGLSAPSKMPCYCYSTPATSCVLGSVLAKLPGTTCSGCYARKGMYAFKNVVAAMERREARLRKALSDPGSRERFISAFAFLLNSRLASTRKRLSRGQKVARDGRYFRWHDSGDVWSADHFAIICEIARRCPEVSFWLPTREFARIRGHLADAPGNLTVRFSAAKVDAPAPAGVIGSAVHTGEVPEGSEGCGAYQRDGECGDCRACWNPSIDISYPLH